MPDTVKAALLPAALLLTGCFEQEISAPADTTAPVLSEVSTVLYGRDTTPDYTFNSTEAGSISYGGACNSATSNAVAGDNTITFDALTYGVYEDCIVQVTDAAGNASAVLAISPFAVAKKPLNDTGITLCGDYAYDDTGYTGSGTHNNIVDCESAASPSSTATQEGFEIANGMDSVPAGQDAHFGRDADSRTNDDADGHKGFSFTKVCNSGEQAGQGSCPADPALGSGVNDWACTLDNVTGLLWEVKTTDGGLRHNTHSYFWYDTDGSNNGGYSGRSNTGGYCSGGTGCDTEKYIQDLSGANLCGYNDWRIPVRTDLNSIVSNSSAYPAIDAVFFPNTLNVEYWTSQSFASNNRYAWAVNFNYGMLGNHDKNDNIRVRAVRGSY